MRLYEIAGEMRHAEELLETWAAEHDGDVTGCPFETVIEGLQMEFDQKALNVAAWIKNLRAEAQAIREEEKRLAARRGPVEAKADRLEAFLQRALIPGESKYKDARVAISWRKSAAVEVTVEPEKLPEWARRVTVSADKSALKDAIKKGEAIEGVRIIENQNIQIK